MQVNMAITIIEILSLKPLPKLTKPTANAMLSIFIRLDQFLSDSIYIINIHCSFCKDPSADHLFFTFYKTILNFYIAEYSMQNLNSDNSAIVHQFIVKYFVIANRIECANRLIYQHTAKCDKCNLLNQLNNCITEDGVALLLKLIAEKEKMQEIFDNATTPLNYLVRFYKFLNNHTIESATYSYLFIMMYDSLGKNTNREWIYCFINEMQLQLPRDKRFLPLENLKIGNTYNNLTIPNVNLCDVLLEQLRMLQKFLFKHDGFSDLFLALVDKINELTDDPFKCLQIVYYYNQSTQINIKQFENQIRNGIKKMLKLKLETNAEKIQFHSLKAGCKLAKYIWLFTDIAEANKDLKFEIAEIPWTYNTNISNEKDLVDILLSASNSYKEFITELNRIKTNLIDWKIECDVAITNLKKIADHLRARNYLNDATRAFYMLFRLAEKCNDTLALISAVSFFAQHPKLFSFIKTTQSLCNIIQNTHQCIVTMVKELDTLSLRKQNVVLFCLMDIALFHFYERKFEDGKTILTFVHGIVIKDENVLEMKYNSARAKYYSVLIEMNVTYKIETSYSPILFIDHILQLSKKIEYKTVDDTIAIPIIFYNTFVTMAKYLMARFNLSTFYLYMAMLFKMTMRSGFALKSAKLLAYMAHFDLIQGKGVDSMVSYR